MGSPARKSSCAWVKLHWAQQAFFSQCGVLQHLHFVVACFSILFLSVVWWPGSEISFRDGIKCLNTLAGDALEGCGNICWRWVTVWGVAQRLLWPHPALWFTKKWRGCVACPGFTFSHCHVFSAAMDRYPPKQILLFCVHFCECKF